MKSITISAFLVLLLSVSSCTSSLSDGKVEDLSAICAKIDIYQNLSDRKDNRVTVFLYDENNKPIDNKNINIKVNGIVLDTVKITRLYYFTSNYYSKHNIPVNDEYKFEIILTDNNTYALGSIKPIAESSENNISLPERGDFDKDVELSWRNLKEINELSISKSVLLKTSNELETNYEYEPTILRKIDANGNYRFPKSSFISSKSILSGIELKFTALKFGEVSKQLLPKSEIKISGQIDKYIGFDEDTKLPGN